LTTLIIFGEAYKLWSPSLQSSPWTSNTVCYVTVMIFNFKILITSRTLSSGYCLHYTILNHPEPAAGWFSANVMTYIQYVNRAWESIRENMKASARESKILWNETAYTKECRLNCNC
jgi:hypothetical protein